MTPSQSAAAAMRATSIFEQADVFPLWCVYPDGRGDSQKQSLGSILFYSGVWVDVHPDQSIVLVVWIMSKSLLSADWPKKNKKQWGSVRPTVSLSLFHSTEWWKLGRALTSRHQAKRAFFYMAAPCRNMCTPIFLSNPSLTGTSYSIFIETAIFSGRF